MTKYLLILLSMLAFSCNNPIMNKNDSVKESENLKVYELPVELKEISGISFLSEDVFLAIQDEDGILYQYNFRENKILKKFEFGKPDDYEDLVRIGNDVYVVSSNGTITQIKDFQSAKPMVSIFKTPLSKKNDIEGLGYEPQKNRLLLGAKANGLDDNDNTKEIYGFDLKSMTLDTKPAYTIHLDHIEGYFKGDAIVESSKKFLKALGNQNLNKIFRISSITVNPKTNRIYVLSSINKLIAVLTPDGKMAHIIQFKGKEFRQPEGIAFSDSGKLYISNEAGKNGKANIIQLEYAN